MRDEGVEAGAEPDEEQPAISAARVTAASAEMIFQPHGAESTPIMCLALRLSP